MVPITEMYPKYCHFQNNDLRQKLNAKASTEAELQNRLEETKTLRMALERQVGDKDRQLQIASSKLTATQVKPSIKAINLCIKILKLRISLSTSRHRGAFEKVRIRLNCCFVFLCAPFIRLLSRRRLDRVDKRVARSVTVYSAFILANSNCQKVQSQCALYGNSTMAGDC